MQQAARVKTRGQSTIELALALPFLLLILLGGTGTGLSILAASQMQTAAFHGALVAARTDPGTTTFSGPNCPAVVTDAAQVAAGQSFNVSVTPSTTSPSPYIDKSSTQYVYGVIPIDTIQVFVTCDNNFGRSSSSATNGNGNLNFVTVNVQGTVSIGFLPFFPSRTFSEQQTTAVEPYRSRS